MLPEVGRRAGYPEILGFLGSAHGSRHTNILGPQQAHGADALNDLSAVFNLYELLRRVKYIVVL